MDFSHVKNIDDYLFSIYRYCTVKLSIFSNQDEFEIYWKCLLCAARI